MPDRMLDLDRYLARIGHDGSRAPTLQTLRALHALHPAAIAFENLDPLMGKPVPLDIRALQRKLVEGGRGGYCFEQNTLFAAALEALGFSVARLAARVQWNRPLTPPGARTHMLLKVELPEGTFLADVGFGLMTLTAPLRAEAGLVQETPHGTFRLAEVGGELQLQALRGDDWSPVYQAALTPLEAADIEMMNWFTATHPAIALHQHAHGSPCGRRHAARPRRQRVFRSWAGRVRAPEAGDGSGSGRRSHRGLRHRPARGKRRRAAADRGGRASPAGPSGRLARAMTFRYRAATRADTLGGSAAEGGQWPLSTFVAGDCPLQALQLKTERNCHEPDLRAHGRGARTGR